MTSPACMLCGCTESMACVEAGGQGCHWIETLPPICSACGRVWAVVRGIINHQGTAGSFAAVKNACRAHREEGYRCDPIS